MKYYLIIAMLCLGSGLKAQQLDSIFFNLYTDSLKRGTYNYINVEGKYTNGTYQPLGEKELKFTSTGGKFHGNSLYIDSSTRVEKVTVTVTSRANPRLSKQVDIYIKKYEAPERLPTMEEVLERKPKDRKRK